jgi:feruloyl esterase
LQSLKLPDTTITMAMTVAAGAFQNPGAPAGPGTPAQPQGQAKGKQAKGGGAPGAPAAPAAQQMLPAYCRVSATLKPSPDSDIKIEVWLPVGAGWNGKYEAVGGGGWAGVISYPALASAVQEGYATSSTDTGHEGGNANFAVGHPEKIVDFSYRAVHEMTVKAKAIIAAYYGDGPKLSYWNGCSSGGKQGLKEAQRFPADYDGIIAGAPANRTALALWVAFAELKDPASTIPQAKYPAVHQAAIAACDSRDGVKDGLIDDPSKCKFDPKVIECKGPDGPSCLTAPQVEAARRIYATALNPRTGQKLFPALVPGSELGWAVLGGGPEASQVILDHFKYVVFKNPAWDWRTFDFDKDIVRSEEPENVVMNATDPNLKQFFGHKGKVLLYHGWADPNISPLSTVQYYKNVVDTMGGEKKTSDSIRLFMAPGMGHCRGGEGPNKFDVEGALDTWVDKGTAPDKLIASHATAGKVDRTRPLCAYPQVAKYKGSGSIDEAANFACMAP